MRKRKGKTHFIWKIINYVKEIEPISNSNCFLFHSLVNVYVKKWNKTQIYPSTFEKKNLFWSSAKNFFQVRFKIWILVISKFRQSSLLLIFVKLAFIFYLFFVKLTIKKDLFS